jgi:hypothetical protein
MLGIVLEALAELIAGSMTPQEGMRDARDVFLALSSRLAAVSGEAGDVPSADPAEVAAAPADLVATAAIDLEAASPEFFGPALRRDSAAPWSGEADVAEGATAAVSAAADQAATAPAGPQASGVAISGTSTQNARVPNNSRVPPRRARRRLFRDRPGFARRSFILRRRNIIFRSRYVIRTLPPRLFCYAACAGPPALLRRA